jgi:DNA-binding protein HU-beta
MAKGLTKSQFMTALAEAWGIKKTEAQEGYEKFVDLVYSEVKSKGEITLPGLGKVVKKDRAARMGRNPATGESIHIAAKTVLKFRINKAAKDAIL